MNEFVEKHFGKKITFKQMPGFMCGEYYCAYFEVDKPLTKIKAQLAEDNGATYGYAKGCKIIGVDTNHGYNMNMSLVQKKKDALSQIKDILEAIK